MLDILLHFGYKNQLKKINEESYELIEALLEEDRKHIVEEIADVQVLLNQFKELWEIRDDEIVEVMEFKIDRTLERIKSGYYDKSKKIKKCTDRVQATGGSKQVCTASGKRV